MNKKHFFTKRIKTKKTNKETKAQLTKVKMEQLAIIFGGNRPIEP